MWFISYAENPYTNPAARAGQNRLVSRLHRTNAAQPDSGIENATSKLKAATGPTAAVSGQSSNASGGTVVSQARLWADRDAGPRVVPGGSSPCVTAYGHQRRHQR